MRPRFEPEMWAALLFLAAIVWLAITITHETPTSQTSVEESSGTFTMHLWASTEGATPTASLRAGPRRRVRSGSHVHSTRPPGVLRAGQLLDVTAYCWTGSRTASGQWPRVGIAAGNIWPIGTVLDVQGVGQVVIEDRIGHGSQLDIHMGRDGCDARADQFGRRQLRVMQQ